MKLLSTLFGWLRLLNSLTNKWTGQTKSEKGSNLVEAALLTPVFLLLFLGVADLGMGFTTYISLTNAAREGSRWMTIHPADKDGTRSRIYYELSSAGLSEGDVDIVFTPDQSQYESGETITIQIRHDYTLLFGAFTELLPTIPFNISATMRVLYDS